MALFQRFESAVSPKQEWGVWFGSAKEARWRLSPKDGDIYAFPARVRWQGSLPLSGLQRGNASPGSPATPHPAASEQDQHAERAVPSFKLQTPSSKLQKTPNSQLQATRYKLQKATAVDGSHSPCTSARVTRHRFASICACICVSGPARTTAGDQEQRLGKEKQANREEQGVEVR